MVSQLGRVTVSAHLLDKGEEEIVVLTAAKTITANDVKEWGAGPKPSSRKNHTYKEIKHGPVTIYQERYQFEFDIGGKKELSAVMTGQTFFIDGKYVVTGHAFNHNDMAKKVDEKNAGKDDDIGQDTIDMLKKIIDRKKTPKLSPAMSAGLMEASFANTVCLVVDFQKLPAKGKEELVGAFKLFGTGNDIKDNVGNVQALAVKLNEMGKVRMSATLVCKDAKAAGVIKGIGERTLSEFKVKLKEAPKIDIPDFQKSISAFNTVVNSIQVTSIGNRVTASAEADPAITIEAMTGAVFGLGQVFTPPPAPKKEPK